MSTGRATFYLVVWTCISAFGAVFLVAGGAPASFAAFFIGAIGWNWFVLLWLFAYEILLSADGTLTFRSVLREETIDARELVSIAPPALTAMAPSYCSRREQGHFDPSEAWTGSPR
jgi:hypothetical protein